MAHPDGTLGQVPRYIVILDAPHVKLRYSSCQAACHPSFGVSSLSFLLRHDTMMPRVFSAIWSLFALGARAVPASFPSGPRAPVAQRSCVFDSANAPTCWGDYSLSTNYYNDGPDTGVVREYWFDIVNGTASPDGVERMVYTINGSLPGPTIFADWGDTVGK